MTPHTATRASGAVAAIANVLSGAIPMAELHRESFEVVPGATRDEKTFCALIQANADGIITDCPGILRRGADIYFRFETGRRAEAVCRIKGKTICSLARTGKENAPDQENQAYRLHGNSGPHSQPR
jgi:hypothetical protein